MHILKLDISGIAGIEQLAINFSSKMNIICGPNGIGKTTILECVAQIFSGQYVNILKRRALSEVGEVQATINDGTADIPSQFTVKNFNPEPGKQYLTPNESVAKHLLSLKVARTFSYAGLNAVSKDVKKEISSISNENKNGLNIAEVKNWFVNRFLYSKHDDSLTKAQLYNFDIAKTFFGLLNPSYTFKKVEASSNEIMVKTPAGDIYYEYLSSGFKSCLSILLGIVKELEFRFSSDGIKVDEFKGVILIDELELHLHPDWQSKIVNVLKKAFPKAQFIVTTHSPHIIQAAQPEEVIALEADGGRIFKRILPDTKYGFQGWTIEEVLRDVMGMDDTRTSVYHDAINEFEKAVDEDSYTDARNAYEKLDSLLHPDNHLRKLLAFQLGALKG